MDLVELWKAEQSAHWQEVAADAQRRKDAWTKLRAHVERERASYADTEGSSKDARMVYAALEGAYGGIVRKMDSLEAKS